MNTHSKNTVRHVGEGLSRRCLLAYDIEAYSRRTYRDQNDAQHAGRQAVDQAIRAAGLPPASMIRQNSGDGELIVLPGPMPDVAVLAKLVPALAEWLREYNRPRRSDLRVRLRVAVHAGLVHTGGALGFPGDAANHVGRLLDAEPVRRVLRERPEVSVAVIVSAETYRDVVAQDYPGIRQDLFKPTRVVDQAKAFQADAWIYTPEPPPIVASIRRRRTHVIRASLGVAVVAAALTTLTAVSSVGRRSPTGPVATSPAASGGTGGTSPAPEPKVFNEFDLALKPAFGYDLDIPPGGNPEKNSGWRGDDETYRHRDIYRTSRTDPTDRLQGVQQPVTATDNHNAVTLVARTDPPQRCRGVSGTGGNVSVQSLAIGSKICVRTREGRPVMLTVTSTAEGRDGTLGVHVTVLNLDTTPANHTSSTR
jgi:hypothetical protein